MKGWLQKELAREAGLKRTQIQAVESGTMVDPGSHDLYAIARALGVSSDYLLTGYQASDAQAQIPVPTDRASVLARLARFPLADLEMLERGATAMFEGERARHAE